MTQSGCTVEHAYREYLIPAICNTRRSTKSDAARYVRFWSEFQSNVGKQFSVLEITTKLLSEFRDWIHGRGLGNGQCNKAFKCIKRCVVLAGEEEGYAVRTIRTQSLPTKPAPKYYITNAQVRALWKACKQATWSAGGIEPVVYWRSILIFLRTYGMRVQDLVAYEKSKSPIDWENIHLAPKTPNPEGLKSWKLGWLHYTASKTGREYYLPLTRAVRGALERLGIKESGLVFPCSMGGTLLKQWRRLQKLAGVKRPNDTYFHLEDFRKTCATYLAEYNGELPYLVCGWTTAQSKIAHDHYIHSERVLVKYLPKAPVPKCFKKWSKPVHKGDVDE